MDVSPSLVNMYVYEDVVIASVCFTVLRCDRVYVSKFVSFYRM